MTNVRIVRAEPPVTDKAPADWPAIDLKVKNRRMMFTPDPKIRQYLDDLFRSGLWGRFPTAVLANIVREGIYAVKARGVVFPCEREVVTNTTKLLPKNRKREARDGRA